MDKFCEDCIHNEVCQYYAIPPHKDRCNDKDTLDDLRPRGEWIVKSNGTTNYYACDKCGSAGDIQDKFCRECGADMRGEDE